MTAIALGKRAHSKSPEPSRTATLPCHQYMPSAELVQICSVVHQFKFIVLNSGVKGNFFFSFALRYRTVFNTGVFLCAPYLIFEEYQLGWIRTKNRSTYSLQLFKIEVLSGNKFGRWQRTTYCVLSLHLRIYSSVACHTPSPSFYPFIYLIARIQSQVAMAKTAWRPKSHSAR